MAALLPGMGLPSSFFAFILVAVAMVVVTVFVLGVVLTSVQGPPLVTQMGLALTVILGGSVLLLALLDAALNPASATAWTWVLAAFNFMMMVPPGLWFVGQILFRDRRIDGAGWLWPLSIGVAATGTEVLMGVLFAVGGLDGPRAVASAVALGLSSVWFYGSMVAVMGALLVWTPLSRVERIGSVALVLAAVAGPWVVAYPEIGGLAMAGVMGAAWAGLSGPLRRRTVSVGEARLLLAFAAAFAGMAVGGLSLALDRGGVGAEIVFGTWMALVMIAEVGFLVRRKCSGVVPAAWGPPLPSAEPGAASSPPSSRPVLEPGP